MSDSELEKTVTENQTEPKTEPTQPVVDKLLAEIEKLEAEIKAGSPNSNLRKIQEEALKQAYATYYASFAGSSAISGSGSTSGFAKQGKKLTFLIPIKVNKHGP